MDLGSKIGETDGIKKLEFELNEIEKKYEEFEKMLMKHVDSSVCRNREASFQEKKPEVRRSLACLKPITIPVFYGTIKEYKNWRSLFKIYIEDADASEQEKLLQLRQYLGGEAIRLVENMGFGPGALSKSLDRLKARYGGDRRMIMLLNEEIEKFKPIRNNELKDIEDLV